MNLRFVFLVAFVVLVATPSLEFIGARAQTPATDEQCEDACTAAKNRNSPVIRGLINDDVDLCDCVCNDDGDKLVHVAVEYNCDVCFDLLISSPSNCPCDCMNDAGDTPLHLAAQDCNGPMTSRAIDASCDVDKTNNNEDTPLCLAARRPNDDNCGQVVRTILRGDAMPCIDCSGGMTACESCADDNTCEVLDQDRACNCP